MKNILSAVCLGAALFAPSLAIAEDESGRIRAVNSWSITLENGAFYTAHDPAMTKDLRPGDAVRVIYADTPDEVIAKKIERRGDN